MGLIFGQAVELVGAGRTDTGVHAKQMYAHFDLDQDFDQKTIVHKLNSLLPKDISIAKIVMVADNAHARFDAVRRTYEYRIHTAKDPFSNGLSWEYKVPLDVDAMNEASKTLLMHSDFQCFSKVDTDVHTFNCRIFAAGWERHGSHLIFTISADRFLRNMVRAIVGTIIDIGSGKLEASDMETIILSRDRKRAGFSVPAHGLFLTKVEYEYIK